MDASLRLLVEAVGILSFAITGMIVAKSHGLTGIGMFLIALAAAFGGGTLRDVLLDARPFYWERFPLYIPAIFVMTGLYVLWPRLHAALSAPKGSARSIVEALAVASLAMGGADKAFELGQAWFMVAIYGVISGGFGGVLRDLLVVELPLLLKPGLWLAEALMAGSLVFAGLVFLGVLPDLAAITGFAVIFGGRMLALAAEHRQTQAHPGVEP